MISLSSTLRWSACILPLIFSMSVMTTAADQRGENIALGKPYTLSPQPSYALCSDPDDDIQLTDGKSTEGHFWTQRGTVGWTRPGFSMITVDLGQVEPVAGVAFTTAAGAASVTWPAEIRILVSDDGMTFRDVGDLVALDHQQNGPWPDGYAIRRVVTHDLATRARYVRFLAIPLAAAPYLFVDEVEVFRGGKELLGRDPGGEVVESAQAIVEQGRARRGLRIRYTQDAGNLQRAIEDSAVEQAVQTQLIERLSKVRKRMSTAAAQSGPDLRAVLPIGEAHAKLFQIQADWWRAVGRPSFSGSVADTWAPLELIGLPPVATPADVQVDTMRQEYRSAAVNLFNASDQVLHARVHFDGLPGSPTPDYVTVHEVAWTDTAQSKPVAAALPEAPREQDAWIVSVPPGLTRQVWCTFHVTDQQAGSYEGKIIVDANGTDNAADTASLEFPIELRIWPFDFPQQTTLHVGGWSYTNSGGRYGVTADNLPEFLKHLQSHFVNAPWSSSGPMKKFKFDPNDPEKIQLDTEQFDEWIEQWPDAKRYHVFLSVAHYGGAISSSLGGVAIDSPEFSQRVGTWISAWVEHLKSKGIRPDQLALLIHDEPHEGSDIESLLAWAKAIRSAQPDVLVWEDPTYRNPAQAPAELFSASDVLCPNRPMWLSRGKSFADFYRQQQKAGRTLEFYSCSGPAKLLDPYSYHRLQAWHAWKVGGTGSYFWAFGDNSGASSWCEYFAKSGPFTPLFLDDSTVTAGKHMEAVRESAEDYEYFVMLRSAMEHAKAHGGSADAIAAAEKLLAHGADAVLDAPGASGIRWQQAKDRTRADVVRVKILTALKGLSRLSE